MATDRADVQLDPLSQKAGTNDQVPPPTPSIINLPASRPHSASISSVHFAKSPLQPRDSVSSVRDVASNGHLSHASSPPSAIDTTSPKSRSTSTFGTSIAIPKHTSYTETTSQDRHPSPKDRSPARTRPGTLIAHGKRPSITTGGYESSSDESATSPALRHTRDRMPSSHSFTGNRQISSPDGRSYSDRGRKRAQSLMSPDVDDGGFSQSANVDRGESQQSKKPASRRLEEIMAVPRNEGKNQPRSATLRSPSYTAPLYPSTRIVSSAGVPTRTSLPRDQVFQAESSSGPSIASSSYMQADMVQGYVTQGRTTAPYKSNGVSSPEGSRTGKGRDTDRRVGGLAASLGLERSGNSIALSPGMSTRKSSFHPLMRPKIK
jgi:hypothetical protein